MKCLLSLLFAFWGCLTLCAEDIRVATLNWEPYIGESLPQNGYVARVVREAFAVKGYTVEFSVMPWARVVKMAEHIQFDAYGPEYYSDDRAENYLLSDPFPGGPLGFFKLKINELQFQSLDDLKDLRIGVVRGYVNTEAFDTADFLFKEEAVDDLTNFKKLIAGRLDLVVADEFVGYYILRKELPLEADSIEFVTPILEQKQLYLCFPKDVSRSRELLRAFNEGLEHIRKNGTLDRLYVELNAP